MEPHDLNGGAGDDERFMDRLALGVVVGLVVLFLAAALVWSGSL
jgi:hypothetical protein